MGLITETSLRAELKNKNIDKYAAKPGTRLTPAAMQYLKDRKIELVFEEPEVLKSTVLPEPGELKEKLPGRYVFADPGCFMNEKPEYMTQLYGRRLVYKDHPRIAFRGALDSLQSRILLLQSEAAAAKKDKLVNELAEVLQYVRNIMRCEVLGEQFQKISLFGLEEEELRKQSQNPARYFNMKHILPDYKMGKLVMELNALRTNVREVEVAAVCAFRKEDSVERDDIIKALNRLSSGVYIMMLRFLAGDYGQVMG